MGVGAESAGTASIVDEAIAAATNYIAPHPSHKTQMFYNVKGGTGKSTLTAQYVMMASMLGYQCSGNPISMAKATSR